MQNRSPRSVALAVRGGKAGALVAVLALVIGFGADPRDRGPESVDGVDGVADVGPGAPLPSAHVQRLMSRFRCSSTGFGQEASPRSALIRKDGRVRHVTFDRGWSTFTGDRPGVFVAVCLSPTSQR